MVNAANNEIVVALEDKTLLQLLSTKYQEFNYTDWLIEFVHRVSIPQQTSIGRKDALHRY